MTNGTFPNGPAASGAPANAVLPVETRADKRVDLATLASMVKDGDTLALGGGLTCRLPMAAVRALVRAGVRNLRVVGSAHGLDVDLLCGAGAVRASAESYVGFEVDFGMAPNYRRACEDGSVTVEDSCCYTIVQQLRATTMGLPFMPVRSIRGTDIGRLNPSYKTMICPFTGEELTLVPALAPDVAILHAQYGDRHGNVRIEGPPVADLLFARASRTVLVTVERIVESDELMAKGGPNVPYFYVSAIAEVPFGAHPTACYPDYAYDRAHIARYYDAAKAGPEAFRERYLTPFVFDAADAQTYLARAGGDAMHARVASWNESPEAWQRLYRDVDESAAAPAAAETAGARA
jgi:glutaconate CoA-transferase subunit A